jgi:hypothetical protein
MKNPEQILNNQPRKRFNFGYRIYSNPAFILTHWLLIGNRGKAFGVEYKCISQKDSTVALQNFHWLLP